MEEYVKSTLYKHSMRLTKHKDKVARHVYPVGQLDI